MSLACPFHGCPLTVHELLAAVVLIPDTNRAVVMCPTCGAAFYAKLRPGKIELGTMWKGRERLWEPSAIITVPGLDVDARERNEGRGHGDVPPCDGLGTSD